MHDFNAREWDLMGTRHNQLHGKRRINNNGHLSQEGSKQSQELKRVPCVLYFSIGNIQSEFEVWGGQNSYHGSRTGNKEARSAPVGEVFYLVLHTGVMPEVA